MKEACNRYGASGTPFFFLIDYTAETWFCQPLDTLDETVRFNLDGFRHADNLPAASLPSYALDPVSYTRYKAAFDMLQSEIAAGNTYLANLTFPTGITSSSRLEDLYSAATARFKLYFQDRFVCFSPERFIRIENDTISTYPMKGTIDATLPGAREAILNDPKELAEHTMVVDLLRNDLSIVAQKVKVADFRYTEEVRTADTPLIQVSSHITGEMEPGWQARIGDILASLLPAGSISGTPKKKSVEILKRIEGYERGFFTGVCGYFDGKILDSAVLIRFVEKTASGLVFKSGGGITADSDARSEYDEMVKKAYVPFS